MPAKGALSAAAPRVAEDFGIHEMALNEWLRKADVKKCGCRGGVRVR